MGSGLEVSPPGHGGAVISVAGILKQVHVGGQQGDVQYPHSEFEFSHIVISVALSHEKMLNAMLGSIRAHHMLLLFSSTSDTCRLVHNGL